MFLAFGDALVGTLARFGDFIVVSCMHNMYFKFNTGLIINQFFGKGKVWVVT
jgi:hypothetical protein